MVRRLHDEETMRSRDSIMREYIEKGLSLQYTTFDVAYASLFDKRLLCLGSPSLFSARAYPFV